MLFFKGNSNDTVRNSALHSLMPTYFLNYFKMWSKHVKAIRLHNKLIRSIILKKLVASK